MHDIDTLESINREQLATASDRLLLRGRVSRPRPRTRWAAPRGSLPRIPHGPLAEGTQPRIVLPPRRTQHPVPPVRAPQPLVIWPPVHERTVPVRRGAMSPVSEQTVPVRRGAMSPVHERTVPVRRGAMSPVSAVALALSPLVGFAVGLAAVL